MYDKFPKPTNLEKLREYLSFIEEASITEYEVFTETHHILPRCLGGTDESDNLKRLSLRDHFLAHKLLAESYEDDIGLSFAFFAMSSKGAATTEEYELARTSYYNLRYKMISERNKSWIPMHIGDEEVCVHRDEIELYLAKGYIVGMSAEHRRKLGESHRGFRHSEEVKMKIRESNKDTHVGDIWINNGSKELTISPEEYREYEELGYMRGRLPFSEEHRKHLSREFSEEHRNNISNSSKRRRKAVKYCKICGAEFLGANTAKYCLLHQGGSLS